MYIYIYTHTYVYLYIHIRIHINSLLPQARHPAPWRPTAGHQSISEHHLARGFCPCISLLALTPCPCEEKRGCVCVCVCVRVCERVTDSINQYQQIIWFVAFVLGFHCSQCPRVRGRERRERGNGAPDVDAHVYVYIQIYIYTYICLYI